MTMRRWILGILLAAALGVMPAHAQKVADAGCCGPVTPAGVQFTQFLDSLDVDHLWPKDTYVNWETGMPEPRNGHHEPHTHCSAFAAAAAKRIGIYMLRPPEHGQSELSAAQERWFGSEAGRRGGWKAVTTPEEAQSLANLGEFVVLVYGDPNPHKSGHIAIVRPAVKSEKQLQKEGPQTTQAGGHNFSSGTAEYSFVFHKGAWPAKVQMYAHTTKFSEAANSTVASNPNALVDDRPLDEPAQ